jgi:predicted transposase/invertase (TIGR01784 family)
MFQDRPLISFDYAAKTVLRNPSNFDVFSGFLSELLCRDVAVQEILEGESLKDNEYEGTNRVDMKVKIDGAEIVVVEIQFEHEADFLQRTLFGVSKAITSQHRKGEKFNDIKKVYSIDIIYFNLSQSSDYIYNGRTNYIGMNTKEELKLAEDKKAFYETEHIGDIYPEYYLIEVNKFDETIRSKFDEWIYFLKTDMVKKEFTAKGLREAKDKLDYLRLSLEEQAEYDRKMNRRSSFISAMDTAKMEGEFIGEARGIERGIAEGEYIGEILGIFQTAKKMKAEGMSVDLISKITNWSKEELAGL